MWGLLGEVMFAAPGFMPNRGTPRPGCTQESTPHKPALDPQHLRLGALPAQSPHIIFVTKKRKSKTPEQQNQRFCSSPDILMQLAAPEPNQAHLSSTSCVIRQFWDHHSQTQPVVQPWATVCSRSLPGSARKQRSTTASLQPQPAVTSPKPCHNFRGTWRKTGVTVTFCWGKAKANAKLTLYAGLASFPPRTAPQQRVGTSLEPRPGSRDPRQRVKAEPSLSCAQEDMEGFGEQVC